MLLISDKSVHQALFPGSKKKFLSFLVVVTNGSFPQMRVENGQWPRPRYNSHRPRRERESGRSAHTASIRLTWRGPPGTAAAEPPLTWSATLAIQPPSAARRAVQLHCSQGFVHSLTFTSICLVDRSFLLLALAGRAGRLGREAGRACQAVKYSCGRAGRAGRAVKAGRRI